MFDVAARVDVGPKLTVVLGEQHRRAQPLGAHRVDRDDRLQLRSPRIEATPLEHGGRGHGRRHGVLDCTRPRLAVDAVPLPTVGQSVDDVGGEQFDAPVVQVLGQHVGQQPVLVEAHAARGAVLVDDHGDDRVGSVGGGDVDQVGEGVVELARQVHAHHAAQLVVLEGHQHQGVLGHEAEDGR